MQKKGFIRQLQVIYKIVDTCNLACTYCYYFNGESYKGHDVRPDYANLNTTQHLVKKLVEFKNDYDVHSLSIVLHGGEPLMMKQDLFIRHLNIIRSAFKTTPIYMQTNGILLNEKWCKLLNKYNIIIGISLDGTKELNDKYRITSSKKGSYDRIVKGINIARKFMLQKNIGVISVINHNFDYNIICNHFSKELGLNDISLLIPDRTNEKPLTNSEIYGYSKALIDAFECHVSESDTNIREIYSFLDNFQRYDLHYTKRYNNNAYNESRILDNEVITIHTNGSINYYDLVYPEVVLKKYGLVNREYSISDINLGDFIFSHPLTEARAQSRKTADECVACNYTKLCYKNAPSYRATHEGYNSKSVYCQVYKNFYDYVISWLVSNGYPRELILSSL